MAAPRHAIAARHDEGSAHVALVGILVASEQSGTYVFFLYDGVLRINLAEPFFAQTDVQNDQLAYELLVFGEQEGQFLQLQGEGDVGLDDVGPHVVGVVFGHQSRRDVDTGDGRRALVDVFHQRCKTSGKRLVEARTEKSVDDKCIGLQFGRVEFVGHFHEFLYLAAFAESLLVDGAVFREFVGGVEQVNRNLVVLVAQHTGHCQRIAAIVSRSGEYHHRLLVVPHRGDGARQRLGCAFHKVDGAYRFVLHRIMVQIVDLIAG